MKLEFRDRHAEHVDGREDLCEHGEYQFYPRDTFKAGVQIGGTTIAEVELEFLDKKTLRMTINHLDYLIEKAKREIDMQAYHEWFERSRS